ncbi:MAG: hypothetical protein J5806_10845 [Lentisphaeria bacterium]|nr:hypothetical protein [Lentisphaeria bacterium]
MKKLLVMCMVLAGAFSFTGYGEDSAQAIGQVAITGFGGYTLGERLNPKAINQQMREKGYVFVKAKTQSRIFEKVQMFFTPKTLTVYNIYACEKGSYDDLKIIKASIESKYQEKMYLFPPYDRWGIERGERVIIIGKGRLWNQDKNYILIADLGLEKQSKVEREEFMREQISTVGL